MNNKDGNSKIKVIVYSDYICPFCYIGFHRIKKLKSQFDLEVEWKPFELHPEIPQEGFSMENLAFPTGYIDMVMTNVKHLADDAGITFKFSNKLPNSRLALSVSEFMKTVAKFDEFHELVFDAYWKEGKDIGNLEFLLEIAKSVGTNKDELLKYIKTEVPSEILREASLELSKYGINGVPTFFIEGRIIVGAQPYDIFEKTINQLLD